MRTCSVCEHPSREEIDAAIHAGLYSSEIGRLFGFTKPTVTGHRRSGHHLLQPRRVSTGPHTASTLLTRISECRGDHEALQDLRIAVGTLPPEERRRLVEALRSRAGLGKVAEPVESAA